MLELPWYAMYENLGRLECKWIYHVRSVPLTPGEYTFHNHEKFICEGNPNNLEELCSLLSVGQKLQWELLPLSQYP